MYVLSRVAQDPVKYLRNKNLLKPTFIKNVSSGDIRNDPLRSRKMMISVLKVEKVICGQPQKTIGPNFAFPFPNYISAKVVFWLSSKFIIKFKI